MTDSADTAYTPPPPPPDGSPGSEPEVTPIPDAPPPGADETATTESDAASDSPVAPTDAGATVRVRVMAGQDLAGVGVLAVGSEVDVSDSDDVRARIEAGLLQLVG